MKCFTPEIAWNSKEAIYSVDFQADADTWWLATAGIDKDVKVWRITYDVSLVQPCFLSNLRGHQQAVNVVRFSPQGDYLASGDVDGMVIIWQLNSVLAAPDVFADDDNGQNLESWMSFRRLRSHLQDVSDVSWSPDSSKLISASVDKSLIVWDVLKGSHVKLIKNPHRHYIVGVKWDLCGRFIVSVSKDRSFIVYSALNYQRLQSVSKAMITNPFSGSGKCDMRLFHDDNLMSFARRPDFSPDGRFLLLPAGCLEYDVKSLECSYLFNTVSFDKPCLVLPSPGKPSIGGRWCPKIFQLNKDEPNLLKLSYRMVYAILTLDAVILYDTQHQFPIGYVSNIHYANLTDLSWSPDGKMIIVSSVDAFCTFIVFEQDELGVVQSIQLSSQSSLLQPKTIDSSAVEVLSTPNHSQTSIAEKLKKFNHNENESPLSTENQNDQTTCGDTAEGKTPRRVSIITLKRPPNEAENSSNIANDSVALSLDPAPHVENGTVKEKPPRKVSFITLS